MAISRASSFSADSSLPAADLEEEFNNIVDNQQDVGWPRTKAAALADQNLYFDTTLASLMTKFGTEAVALQTAGNVAKSAMVLFQGSDNVSQEMQMRSSDTSSAHWFSADELLMHEFLS